MKSGRTEVKNSDNNDNKKRKSLVPKRREKKNKLSIPSIDLEPVNEIIQNGNTPTYRENHNGKIIEKVTIKNTTTKSIETITPDGFYTNATQKDENLKEYTRYGNSSKNIIDDIIEIYPNENKQLSPDILLLEDSSRQNNEICLEAVKQDGLLLRYVNPRYRNKMIEHIAVRQNGLALQYIEGERQSDEICLEAVQQNGFALKYVKNQSLEICKAALRENWVSFHLILDKTAPICQEAVKINGLLLEFIKMQTEDLCLMAIEQNPFAIEFVLNQTDEICRKALYKSGLCLEFVQNKTPELCLLALQQNSLAIRYIPIKLLSGEIDLKDYVFIYSDKHTIVSSIKEVRGLRQINIKRNEDGYLIINSLLQSDLPTSFVLQKDDNYIDDYVVSIIKEKKHFVELV